MAIKTVLVTGANAGIGRALSVEFLKRGYKLYATDLRFSDETVAAFNAISKNFSCLVMDVTSDEAVRAVRDRVASETGDKLDFLYCNAGRVEVTLAVDLSDEQIRSLYELNLFSNMRLVREFSRLVVNSAGTIAFSGSATKGLPLHSNALYSSSKAALDAYACVLQCELRNYGVKVIDVVGGYIKTTIFDTHASKVKPGSIFDFKEYTDEYARRSQRLQDTTADSMDPEEFAKRTLNKIEKADLNTLRIYEGRKAGTIDLLTRFASTKLLADKMLNIFHLNFNYRKHLEK